MHNYASYILTEFCTLQLYGWVGRVITKFIYAIELDDTSSESFNTATVICNNIDNNLTADVHTESTQL